MDFPARNVMFPEHYQSVPPVSMTFPECYRDGHDVEFFEGLGMLFGESSGINTDQSVFGPTIQSVKVTLKQS